MALFQVNDKFSLDAANYIRKLFRSNTVPSNPSENEVWWDSSVSTRFFLKMYDGANWKTLVNNEYADRTINLNSSMTLAEIHAEIENIGYIMPGVTITIQFADGTYTHTGPIVFQNIRGAGKCIVQGNTSDSGKGTLYQVHINSSGTECNSVEIKDIHCEFHFRYIKNSYDNQNTSHHGILVGENCTGKISIYDGYSIGTSHSIGDNGAGLAVINCPVSVEFSNYYVTDGRFGLYGENCAPIISKACEDTGTQPAIGQSANGCNIHIVGARIDGSGSITLATDGEVYQ